MRKFLPISRIHLATVLLLVHAALTSSLAGAQVLRILCWEGYADQRYLDGFKSYAKKNLKKDVTFIVTNVSNPNEWFEALRSGSHDLLGGVAHNLPRSDRWKMIDNGLLAEVDLKNVGNYQQVVSALQKADYITEAGKVYGVPYTYGPYALVYNSAIIKEEPKSWSILWDEKYKDRYSLSADYYEANIYVAALAAGINRSDIFSYDKVNSPDVQKRLKSLAQNAKNYWTGVDSAKELKGLALAAAWGFSLPELNRLGEPWKVAHPREGTTAWVDNWVMPKQIEKNPSLKLLAEQWINYSLSPEVQLGLLRNIGSYPVIDRLTKQATADEISRFGLDDPTHFQKNFILWKPLDARSTNGFKGLWEDARSPKSSP